MLLLSWWVPTLVQAEILIKVLPRLAHGSSFSLKA